MIKAIMFDAGGVIIHHGSQLDEFVKIFNPKDREEFWEKINHYVGPLCSGEISEKEYWERIAKSENVDINAIPDNLWEIDYEKSTQLNDEVIALIDKLHKKYKLILVSNTIRSHAKVNKARGVFKHFDDVVNSYEVHLSKDTPEIFELTLKRNNLKPHQCIFIDDIQKFVDVANSIGIIGILFKNIDQLKSDLKNYSIE